MYDIKPGTVIYFRFKSKDETIYKFTVTDVKWTTYWTICYVEENDTSVKNFAINDKSMAGKDIHFVFYCKERNLKNISKNDIDKFESSFYLELFGDVYKGYKWYQFYLYDSTDEWNNIKDLEISGEINKTQYIYIH